jgi:photosystem II stability/assembly factor-like uncharacterized protein
MNRLYLAILFALILFGPGWADPVMVFDDPILALLANSAVDIVWDGEYVWIATEKGLSGTNDGGFTWRSYDSSNGLTADEISALAYGSGRLWVANSSTVESSGQTIPVGEGFSFTDDYGDTFVVDSPHQSTGAGMICYDLAVYDSVTFAACFYGGLIYTEDGGNTWQNLFPDSAAKQDFDDSIYNDLNNRFFAVAVDGNYNGNDTVVVWTGTAKGINQFQFIDPPGKLSQNHINDIVHSVAEGGNKLYTWIATTGGLSRSENNGESYQSFFKSDGLTANHTSSVAAQGDYIIAAGYDESADSAAGFAFSEDNGENWEQSYPDDAVGAGKKVEAIIITSGANPEVWAACTRGGLIRSLDWGESWEKVVLDQEFESPDSLFNQILSLAVYQRPLEQFPTNYNYILAGCGLGLWVIPIDRSYDFQDSLELIRLDELEVAGRKVVDVEANIWISSDETDTTFEWAIASRMLQDEGVNAVLLSIDQGEEWSASLLGYKTRDLTYSDSTIWAATEAGLWRHHRATGNWIPVTIGDPLPEEPVYLDTFLTAISFDEQAVIFWAGSEDGIAQSANSLIWSIDSVNLDQSKFDYNIRATSADQGLTGNFVVAIEVQYYNGERIVWAAGNSTGSGETNGINVSFDNGVTWEEVMRNVNAWNFAIDEEDVYAATSHGLLKTSDFGETWDTLTVLDLETGLEIFPNTEFFGVCNADGTIWVASDDGIAATPDGGFTWDVFRTFIDLPDESGFNAAAAPLPSSPFSSPGGIVRLLYRFENSGDVTIEIYDFAMDLVATPVRNAFREGGMTHSIDYWDMKNDNGRIVSTGVYYFKVENSSGGEEWGKILVIP